MRKFLNYYLFSDIREKLFSSNAYIGNKGIGIIVRTSLSELSEIKNSIELSGFYI